MAKPTVTRAELRRMIGMELGMPFYRRYNADVRTFTTGSVSAPKDAGLEGAADIWNNMMMWITTTGAGNEELRKILDYSTGRVFTPDAALTSNPALGKTHYEILSVFSPYEIHQAINQALDAAYPEFFDTVLDTSLILVHDVLEYDLTAFASPVRIPLALWAEQNQSVISGVVDTHDNTYITDADADFSEVTAGWLISFYDGTGYGQQRIVASVSGQQVNVTVAWTTHPDPETKYKLWNPNQPGMDWFELTSYRFDIREGPTKLNLSHNMNSLEGMRLRLQYVASPLKLTTDAATTYVPAEFIISYAMAHLSKTRMNDNKSDRSRYQMMYQTHSQAAAEYKRFHAWRMPATRLMTEPDAYISHNSSPYSPF